MDTPVLTPSTTTIPKSSDPAVEIINSLSDNVYKIQTIDDIGEFMALYSDAARTGLLCYLPLAGRVPIEVFIPVGSSVFIGAVDDFAEITDITFDSRQVQPGSLYACMKGTKVDGHDFIPQAVNKGAEAIL
jgi:hypothetical protein